MESERAELPAAFEDAPMDSLVHLIADMLQRLMAHNDQIPLSPESLTRFHSRSTPSITVLDYLKRIVRYTNVEKTCLLITLYYIDLICSRIPLFTLSSLTCHRFIIASITASSKGLCDTFCTNNLYAKCTRELLQEYYVNLVRTHSSGSYVITGSESPLESDVDMDSRTPSPSDPGARARHRRRLSVHETSTILIDPAPMPQDVAPRRPTIEQNMAFAALRESQAPSDKG
ncbi:Nuc-1 negative regulatory protein preg [Termitomyces sp. J132]|nr:Nuc-1 negative regulatory protein preg [Termitomyces sp. J132]